ncbi:MAG: AMP-binding protein, partial [Lacipirellulaceae bacterium]
GAKLQAAYSPGERVLLVYPPGLEFIAGFFGTLYAGLLPVPATYPKPRRPLPRLDAIAADCAPKAALTTADTLSLLKLEEQSTAVRELEWLATDAVPVETGESFEPFAPQPTDAAFLQYTSGSTSQPRGVVVSHGNVMHNRASICQGFGIEYQPEGPATRGAFWLPAYHDMGLIGGVLTPIFVGGDSSLMAPAAFLRSPITWLEAMSNTGASISGAPNFAYDLCVEKTTPEQRAGLDLSGWELAFCGAEPVDPATLNRFAEAFEPHGFRREAFYPCYGLAESTLMVTGGYREKQPGIVYLDREELTQKRVVRVESNGSIPSPAKAKTLVSCGRVLGGQEVLIVDAATQKTCAPGEIGEVWVRGESVATGYWQQASADCPTFAATLANGIEGQNRFMRTGDLGFIDDEPGEPELYVTGRTKDVIIIRGRNHYPQDIERSAQEAHLAIDMGAAFSVEAEGGEQLVVVHQVHREHRRGNLDEAVQAVRSAIVDQHEINPQAIVLIKPASLPLTTSGKVQRSRCRDLYEAGELSVLAYWKQPVLESSTEASLESPLGITPPTAVPAPDFLDNVSGMEATELAAAVERWMLALLATKVENNTATISGDTPFSELGIDSMTSIELSLEFEQALNLQLPPDAAWSYPTPATLSQFLAEQLQAVPQPAADLSAAS